MELQEIGAVEDVESLDFSPITVPIVGYTNDKKKVVTKIRFKRRPAPGFARDMVRSIDKQGKLTNNIALEYVEGCVFSEDREKWEELLHSDTVNVSYDTIADVYLALGEAYTGRPLMQRSGSSDGRKSTRPTSQGAAKSRTSTKKASL